MSNENDRHKEIVNNLHQEIKAQRHTMAAFAGAIGITETGLYNMLSNGDMKLSTFLRACEQLELPPEKMFGTSQNSEVNLKKMIELYEENRKLYEKILQLHEEIS